MHEPRWMPRPHPEAVWAVKTVLQQLLSAGRIAGPLPQHTEGLLNAGYKLAQNDEFWNQLPPRLGSMTRQELLDLLKRGLSQSYALG